MTVKRNVKSEIADQMVGTNACQFLNLTSSKQVSVYKTNKKKRMKEPSPQHVVNIIQFVRDRKTLENRWNKDSLKYSPRRSRL
jgi:hypothetical protein